VRLLLRWTAWLVGLVVGALIVATVATTRYGDAALYPPPVGSPRVQVVVAANLYHSGVIIPRAALAQAAHRRNLAALAAVAARFSKDPWLDFGWGDEGFYTRVPTTAELTTALALRALFRPGNPSVVHVAGLEQHPRASFPEASMVALSLSERGFDRLAAMLDATFARKGVDGGVEELGRGLYGDSQFYRAVGTFNILRVCNHWMADLLDAAGVPTAPVLATMPQGLLWDLSIRAGAVPLPAVAPPTSGKT